MAWGASMSGDTRLEEGALGEKANPCYREVRREQPTRRTTLCQDIYLAG